MSGIGWRLHGDGRSIGVGEVVRPEERLSWPRTTGIGLQHVVAMFGATFLVPNITGFPPATTLFFSAVGTVAFLLLTRNRLPSYLGLVVRVPRAHRGGEGRRRARGRAGRRRARGRAARGRSAWSSRRWAPGGSTSLMPPVVTGTIVALIGLNLAPTARNGFDDGAGHRAGHAALDHPRDGPVPRDPRAARHPRRRARRATSSRRLRGEVDLGGVGRRGLGRPAGVHRTVRSTSRSSGLFAPVVFVLVAENVGHVKSVAAMTDRNLDPLMGRALLADGLATGLAGLGGGSGTTTYAENIGVMAATRVYSTAAYWVAAGAALVLSMSPKFGELIATIPAGVLGGATTMLYGMIGILGARIWVQNRVDFSDPVNLTTAAVALVVGIANFTWARGERVVRGHRPGHRRGDRDLPPHADALPLARYRSGAREPRLRARRGRDPPLTLVSRRAAPAPARRRPAGGRRPPGRAARTPPGRPAARPG